MQTNLGNYAFIDSQNLNLATQNLGWKVDWQRFRQYLKEHYAVEVAYLFIGYIPENQDLYAFLQKAGFVLVFKPVVAAKDGSVKGNIDAELVMQVMLDLAHYDKAVIVTGDGDFHVLINYLYGQGKLAALLVPNQHQYSQLLKSAARDQIQFMNQLRRRLEYRNHRSRKPSKTAAETRPAQDSAAHESELPQTG